MTKQVRLHVGVAVRGLVDIRLVDDEEDLQLVVSNAASILHPNR
jgi:hypothetical protein